MKSILQKIKNIIKTFVEYMTIKTITQGNRVLKQLDNNIIMLVKLDAIGDFIIWLDAAKEFRSVYPGKKIILVCNGIYSDLAEQVGYFDEVVPINVGAIRKSMNISARRKLRKELKKYKAEKVIQLVYARMLFMDYVAASIYAVEKITIKGIADNMKQKSMNETDKIYSYKIDTTDEWLMEIQRNALVIRKLGYEEFQSSLPVIPELSTESEIIPKQPYFVVFPGGSYQEKLWPANRFANVADKMIAKTGWKCCICGAQNESNIADELLHHLDVQQCINLVGKTSITELVEIIRNAEFLISNDTSGVHIAAATDTKALCIVGGWHYGHFLPYEVDNAKGRELPYVCCKKETCFGCNYNLTRECLEHKELRKKTLCVDKVDEDMVSDYVMEILNLH